MDEIIFHGNFKAPGKNKKKKHRENFFSAFFFSISPAEKKFHKTKRGSHFAGPIMSTGSNAK